MSGILNRLRHVVVAALLCTIVLLAGCGDDGDGGSADDDGSDGGSDGTIEAPTDPRDTDDAEVADDAVFVTQLYPDEEVPPSDTRGSGTAYVWIDGDEVCLDMAAVVRDETITDAHIHQGPQGENGPIVVEIGEPDAIDDDTHSWTSCVDAGDVVDELEADPTAYYLNVHTDAFPDGAIRGQLAPA